MTEPRPDLDDIREALNALGRVSDKTLSLRYAEMWLTDAARATSREKEAELLSRAEQQLGRAILASGAPGQNVSLAYSLTQRARSDSID